MRARSVLVVVDDGGVTRATRIRGEVPLVIRTLADADGGLTAYLVGGAAGPLGGDDLALTIEVGEGARLRLRSAAASMAMPGPHGHRSTARIEARVAANGELDWWPEPLVSVAGSDHAIHAAIDLDTGASMRWVDEIVLGRHDEPGGRLASRQRLQVGGEVLLDHELVSGHQHLDGPGANGPFRAIATALVHCRRDLPVTAPRVDPHVRAATFTIGPSTSLSIALAHDRHDAAAAIDADAHAWQRPVQFP